MCHILGDRLAPEKTVIKKRRLSVLKLRGVYDKMDIAAGKSREEG